MPCRVCAALKREISREGETEAVATLDLRARFAGPVADHSLQAIDLESVILISRKRRAHIATELYAHYEGVHGEEAHRVPGVREAASA